jgi:hypothetical protein
MANREFKYGRDLSRSAAPGTTSGIGRQAADFGRFRVVSPDSTAEHHISNRIAAPDNFLRVCVNFTTQITTHLSRDEDETTLAGRNIQMYWPGRTNVHVNITLLKLASLWTVLDVGRLSCDARESCLDRRPGHSEPLECIPRTGGGPLLAGREPLSIIPTDTGRIA